VITLTTTLNTMLRTGNMGEKLVKIAMDIANMVEAESRVLLLKQGKEMPFWQKKLVAEANSRIANTRMLSTFNARLRKVSQGEEWSAVMKARVGAKLVDVLLKTAQHDDGTPSFLYTNNFYQPFTAGSSRDSGYKRLGFIRMEPKKFVDFSSLPLKDSTLLIPRYLPMLVPPKQWDNREYTGAYFAMKAPLMKAESTQQSMAVRHGQMSAVLESLDFLGQMGWRINPVVHNVIKAAWDMNLPIAELPAALTLPMPEQSACYRTVREINAPKMRSMARREAAEALKAKIAAERGEPYEPPAFLTKPAVEEDLDEVRFDEKFYKHLCACVKEERRNPLDALRRVDQAQHRREVQR